MALEYFLYTTAYTNTLVGRSNTSFVPSPPYDEIHIDYFIPNYQPLYYYRESGGTIVINSEANINAYLQGTAPAPQPEDPVFQETFTGYTATTKTEIGVKHNTSDFNSFTGTTLPAGYYNKTQINSYSASTLTNINSRLLKADFNTFSGTTLPATYLNKAAFNIYSGTTIPNTYYNKTQINTYTGATATAIGLKANIASPTFTGIPAAPTAAIGTNTTQLATTAYYIGSAANVNPLMDNTVSIGTSTRFARQDHVHPKDTAKANLAGGAAFTGTITVPKPALNDNTTCVATTSWYVSQAGTATPLMNANAAVGTSLLFSRQDHVHPRDTSKLSLSGGTMTGTLCMTDAYMTTPSTGGTLSDYSVVWNPATKEVRTIAPGGDASVYCYVDVRTPQNNTTTTNTQFINQTWTVPAGTYEFEYNAMYGNDTANRCAIVCFMLDGAVVGYCNLSKTNDTNAVTTAYVTQDNVLTAASHTFQILHRQQGGGTSTIYYGSIRVQKIA